ncbi:MAG: energy transducer TonB [Candidatus Desulfacyla sp.]
MKGVHGKTGIEERNGQRWTRGVVVSLLFHVLLLSLILFVPESMPTRRIGGAAIYEVNLVEMPSAGRSAGPQVSVEKSGKEVSRPKAPPAAPAAPAARRITPPSAPEEKPVVIGKRVVERKKEEKQEAKKPPQPEVSPSKLIDGAISKIENKVKTEKTDHLAKALSKVANKVKTEKTDHLAKALSQIETRAQGEGQGVAGEGGTESGVTMRMYELAVWEQITSNWSYPVALMDDKKQKDLEAIVVVKVRDDGTILKSWFTQRSASSIFDGSVLRAIERSDPLPPFPEGYRKSTDEIEFRFNLSEMAEF